jgi:hypothetical protein
LQAKRNSSLIAALLFVFAQDNASGFWMTLCFYSIWFEDIYFWRQASSVSMVKHLLGWPSFVDALHLLPPLTLSLV